MEWARTGEFVRMVTRESATHTTDQICHEIPIHADHSTMVKFDSRSDTNCINIRTHLVQLAKEAPDIIRDRFLKGKLKTRVGGNTVVVGYGRGNDLYLKERKSDRCYVEIV